MSQSDHQLLIHSKPYLSAAIFAGLLSATSLIEGQFLVAVFAAALCSMLVLNKVKSENPLDDEQNVQWLKYSSLGFAGLTVLGLMLDIVIVNTWLYVVPLFIFFFYEFKPALWIVGIFSLLALSSLNASENTFETIQIGLNYLLYLGISGSLVYLREVRRRQLKPLRRTDNLTMAASREHLDHDLSKEILRSEREGSELATLALKADDISLSKLSPKEQDAVTISIGKLLHNNLRLFDSYYLWDNHEFLVVLPHTSSAQAVKIANTLRVQIRKELSVKDEQITVSVGVAGLNVGDDSRALTQRAAHALKETQANGRNRTLLHRDKKDSEHEEPSERSEP